MAEEPEQDRSEQASHFKLTKARRKGTVPRGADLGFAVGLAAFAAYAWINGPKLGAALSLDLRRALVAAPNVVDGADAIEAVTSQVLLAAVRPVGFLVATTFAAVLAFELVQTGVVFSGEPLRPDFGRLDPARGFKRVFSVQTLIQTAKTLVKFVAYAVIAGLVIQEALTPAATISDAHALSEMLLRRGLKLILLFALAAVAIAALDQFLSRRMFSHRMRMSRRELKREVRDREGDPRLKQRRKQLHAEFVKLSQSLRGIRGADILITNPTHFAVALRYDPKTMAAPKVVALGSNQLAQRLKRLAFLYNVPILEKRALAQALFLRGKINKPVPDAFFRPVADAYIVIRRRSAPASGTRHV